MDLLGKGSIPRLGLILLYATRGCTPQIMYNNLNTPSLPLWPIQTVVSQIYLPYLSTAPINLTPSIPYLHRLPPLHHHQRSAQSLLTPPPPVTQFPLQSGQARAPPDWQSPPQLLFHLRALVHHIPARRPLALRHGVHGRSQEEADGFVDVGFRGDGGEGEFGEGFGDADYGFELADGDGDAGAGVGGDLGGVDLAADGNEVGR